MVQGGWSPALGLAPRRPPQLLSPGAESQGSQALVKGNTTSRKPPRMLPRACQHSLFYAYFSIYYIWGPMSTVLFYNVGGW